VTRCYPHLSRTATWVCCRRSAMLECPHYDKNRLHGNARIRRTILERAD
jgi:hypothetical protein